MSDGPRLSEAEHEVLAQRLLDAIDAGRGIDPPSSTIPLTIEDAYRVRRRLVDHLIARGARPRGHKIGFTGEAMQRMYGMTGPDFGQLLDYMFVPAGAKVPASTLADARAEPEIAFELARPLRGPGVEVGDVLDAVRCVRAAVEVIDSRVGAVRARGVDSAADNAGAGRVVLGEVEVGPRDVDLAELTMTFRADGESQTGRAGDVMGHPAAPVAWLANRLAAMDGLGGSLDEGDVVISGSPVRSVAVAAGSRLDADFGPLGTIGIDFS